MMSRIASTLTILALAVTGAWQMPAAHAADDPLEQTVSADETINDGYVVIDHGHVDIGPRIVDGQWVVMARDDSAQTPTWHYLEDVVIAVRDEAQMSIPSEGGYGFLGAAPTWYVIPQTEKQGVVWLGWNTQDPQVSAQVQRGVTMTLGPVAGPGESYLFLQDGTFGEPRLLMNGVDGNAHDVWVDVNTHVHANWAFSAPGVYTTPLSFTAETNDGATLTHTSVLRFAVGNETDPQLALDALAKLPAPATPQETSTPANPQNTQAGQAAEQSSESGNEAWPAWLWAVIVGSLALPLGAFIFVRQQKSQSEARQAMTEARQARENAGTTGADR